MVGFSLKQHNLCPRVYRDHISDCMNLTSNVVISSKSFSNLIWRINQKIRNKSSQMVINSLVKIGLWWKIVYEYSSRDEHGHWIILGSRPLLCEFDESKPVWKRFDNDLDWPTGYSRTKSWSGNPKAKRLIHHHYSLRPKLLANHNGFWFSPLVSFDQYYQFPRITFMLFNRDPWTRSKANTSVVSSFLITLAAIKVFPVWKFHLKIKTFIGRCK